jgi:hypothetical protein
MTFALLAPLSGCELQDCDNPETGAEGVCVKSLKRFESGPETHSATWAPGASVTIDSPNGDVRVVQGDDDAAVSVTFEPFVLRAFDTPEEEVAEDLASLNRSVRSQGPPATTESGVVVDVSRPSGSPTLGADITVRLPPIFNGTLDVDQTNGSTEVDFVGAAVAVIVASNNGGCDIATGSASNIDVHCDNGDLEASVSAVAPQAGSGFSTGNGSITLSLPSDAVFVVRAQALAGGTVDFDNLPDVCTVEASDSAKTVNCNGATNDDPVYDATADGTSLADVILVFSP